MSVDNENVGPDTPLSLEDAVRRAFPAAAITVSGLRKEAGRERLEIEVIAGKQFTTLRAIGWWRALSIRLGRRRWPNRRDWRPTTNAFGVNGWRRQARRNSTRSAILRRICPHSGRPQQPPGTNAKRSSDCCSNVSWSKWCTTQSRFVSCAIGTAAIEPCTG